MPRSATEIPHLAFTHHRIAVHDRAAPVGKGGGGLVAFADLSRFSDSDQRRSLGLAYLESSDRAKDRWTVEAHRLRARELLSGVHAEGLPDPTVLAALARIRFYDGVGGALELADAALADPALRASDRCNVLFLRADALFLERRHAEAAAALRELVKLRRHAADWLMLADCERALGHTDAWPTALEMAARIDPRNRRAHAALAEHHERRGNAEKAQWHRARAMK
jgi:hypothetical protein